MTNDANAPTSSTTGTTRVKRGLADMLKGGVIMDVVTPDQARIAEDAGAVAVMALERVPADIRAQGGVARMSDPDLVDGIIEAVSIPVMAKARIGHSVEAAFPANVALAAMMVERGQAVPPIGGSKSESLMTRKVKQAVVTSVGHWRGEGMALVEAV